METDLQGVRIGLWIPDGWSADTSDGLIIAEESATMDAGLPAAGVLAYWFAPPLEQFNLADDVDNVALAALMRVVSEPHRNHLGDVMLTEPLAFEWSGHDAAYYLYATSDHMKTIVLALEVPGSAQLLVANISMPAAEAGHARAMLAQMLRGLMIDGVVMDDEILNALPDPLPFPSYGSTAQLPSPPRRLVVQ